MTGTQLQGQGSRMLLTLSGLATLTLAYTASEILLTVDFPEPVLSIAILCFKNHQIQSQSMYFFKFFWGHAPKLPRRLILHILGCALHTEDESSWILFLPCQSFPWGWLNWLIFGSCGSDALVLYKYYAQISTLASFQWTKICTYELAVLVGFADLWVGF